MDAMFTVVGGVLLFGLVVLAAIVGVVAWGVGRAKNELTKESRYEMPAYRHLDVNVGSTPEEISQILARCKDGAGVGQRAERAIRQLEDAQRKLESVKASASGRYTRSDLGLDALTEVTGEADDAYSRLVRNCAGLANAAQTFDARDYKELKRRRPGTRNAPDPAQVRRLQDMEERLATMDGILAANEECLLKLDRLSANLEWLEREGTAGTGASGRAAVDDELKGYAPGRS